mmetsp:Transcript_41062/g.53849  ORF Transcript_41062/g.53849 Transcript_41062/m.53849 type:complete len:151 (+) Transcript_41062:535-987(+)
MLWTDHELMQFQDAVLIENVRRYRREFEEEWDLIYSTLSSNNYDHIIPGISDPSKKEELRETYIWAFCGVVTRCFGGGLPCTTMAPFADTINHHNVDSSYDLIKAEWRPLPLDDKLSRFADEAEGPTSIAEAMTSEVAPSDTTGDANTVE